MALFVAHPFSVYLLSLLLSSLAEQAVVLEEPFTSLIQGVVNVFFMIYVVMIAIQVQMVSFHTYM